MAGMAFDEHLHPRSRNGTFADKTHSDPETRLAPSREECLTELADFMLAGADEHSLARSSRVGLAEYDGDTRPAIDRHVTREDVAPGLLAFDEYVDMFVSSVDEGHLSRGVAGRRRVPVARAWALDAALLAQGGDEDAAEFRDGVHRGVIALYFEKVDYEGSLMELTGPGLGDAFDRALTVAETKRASREERALWRENLQHASSGEHRGMLVAAAALSGTDRWWGFRDRQRDVITGRI